MSVGRKVPGKLTARTVRKEIVAKTEQECNMKLRLDREQNLLTCTIGKLYIDGVFESHTLEDVVREKPGVPVLNWKIKGDTAIPKGTYNVIVTWSPKFSKPMPLLLNVPGFEGVRIHSGNTDRDTEGCILVGSEVSGESILKSRDAYNKLYDKMVSAIKESQNITITIGDKK
jgi:hypothetical protein